MWLCVELIYLQYREVGRAGERGARLENTIDFLLHRGHPFSYTQSS